MDVLRRRATVANPAPIKDVFKTTAFFSLYFFQSTKQSLLKCAITFV